MVQVEVPDPWPLGRLVLRTPRLELRPDDDAGLHELVAEAYRGVHDPASMPFGVPWTDAPAAELGRNMLQFYWSQRAGLQPHDWTINFLVRLDGVVVGTQGLAAREFAVTRELNTGSWIGRRFQGRGIGTEMRAAVLQFGFDRLGAELARSEAWLDNAASNAVSCRLGYAADGTATYARRGVQAVQQRLLVTRDAFKRPDWDVEVDGYTDACRVQFAA